MNDEKHDLINELYNALAENAKAWADLQQIQLVVNYGKERLAKEEKRIKARISELGKEMKNEQPL